MKQEKRKQGDRQKQPSGLLMDESRYNERSHYEREIRAD